MADESSKLTVRCPDCGSDLVIDASTGAVLSHRKAKQPLAGGKDFDSLLKGIDDDKNRAEDIFQREGKSGPMVMVLVEDEFATSDGRPLLTSTNTNIMR